MQKNNLLIYNESYRLADDGTYVYKIEENFPYQNKLGQDMLGIKFRRTAGGRTYEHTKIVPRTLDTGTPLQIMIKSLDLLPEDGGLFDLDSLIGMNVEIDIKNNIKDGVRYSNIVAVRLPCKDFAENITEKDVSESQRTTVSCSKLPLRSTSSGSSNSKPLTSPKETQEYHDGEAKRAAKKPLSTYIPRERPSSQPNEGVDEQNVSNGDLFND